MELVSRLFWYFGGSIHYPLSKALKFRGKVISLVLFVLVTLMLLGFLLVSPFGREGPSSDLMIGISVCLDIHAQIEVLESLSPKEKNCLSLGNDTGEVWLPGFRWYISML